MQNLKTFPIEEALQAQQSLRAAAGLEPEQFPIEAFVGMISDEIELLREQGRSDAEIAAMIRDNSAIEISGEEIRDHYAPPRARRPAGN